MATEQVRLMQWENAETNRMAIQQKDRLKKARDRFLSMVRRKSGFDSDFTTVEEYCFVFDNYVRRESQGFVNYMKGLNVYPIGTQAEEWSNLGTGGAVSFLFQKDGDDRAWVLSYKAKGVNEGKKVSVAVYDRNGLFIER